MVTLFLLNGTFNGVTEMVQKMELVAGLNAHPRDLFCRKLNVEYFLSEKFFYMGLIGELYCKSWNLKHL